MARLEVQFLFGGEDYLKALRRIQAILFLDIFDEFDNLETMLNVLGIPTEDE